MAILLQTCTIKLTSDLQEVQAIRVAVKTFHFEVFGKGLLTLDPNDGATLRDILNEVDRRFGDKFREKTGADLQQALRSHLRIYLNGVHVSFPAESDRKLKDGDELSILRPISGGSTEFGEAL